MNFRYDIIHALQNTRAKIPPQIDAVMCWYTGLGLPVASLVGGGPPRVTPSRGVTPEGKKLWANLQRIVEKRGRTGKKGVGDTLEGVTPE